MNFFENVFSEGIIPDFIASLRAGTTTVVYLLLAVVLLALLITWLLAVLRNDAEERREEHRRWEERMRDSVFNGSFIPAPVFEQNWITGDGRGRYGFGGYKYVDGPGCYVILIFDHEVEGNGWGLFDDIYIGQSINMCKRVHAHFSGKGNGDVYADYRNGKYVYAQFRPCAKERLNDLEKALIAAFHATNSYNGTRGGGAKR